MIREKGRPLVAPFRKPRASGDDPATSLLRTQVEQ